MSSQVAQECVKRISKGTSPAPRLCLCGCGRSFVPAREWQVYYSDDCRKRGNKQLLSRKVPSDLRATLTRIESKLDALIARDGHPHA